MRLVTIPFSHYCEKARWALDLGSLPYVEEAHLPGLHVGPMRRNGGRTVPVLVADGATFTESTAILDYVDRVAPGAIWPLDPDARAAARSLVDDFDRGLGVATRRLAYHFLLPVPGTFVEVVGGSLSRTERAVVRAALPLIRPLVRRRYGVTAAFVASALETVDEAFDRVADRLRSGSRYLAGDQISGADVTFAALASPLLLPPGHPGYDGSAPERLPAEMGRALGRLRAHPAGQHALRMYADHRHALVAARA